MIDQQPDTLAESPPRLSLQSWTRFLNFVTFACPTFCSSEHDWYRFSRPNSEHDSAYRYRPAGGADPADGASSGKGPTAAESGRASADVGGRVQRTTGTGKWHQSSESRAGESKEVDASQPSHSRTSQNKPEHNRKTKHKQSDQTSRS